MTKKVDTLKKYMADGEWEAAIKFASKFPRLGDHKDVIKRASSALLSPSFYASMGYDVPALVKQGQQALLERYS